MDKPQIILGFAAHSIDFDAECLLLVERDERTRSKVQELQTDTWIEKAVSRWRVELLIEYWWCEYHATLPLRGQTQEPPVVIDWSRDMDCL